MNHIITVIVKQAFTCQIRKRKEISNDLGHNRMNAMQEIVKSVERVTHSKSESFKVLLQ